MNLTLKKQAIIFTIISIFLSLITLAVPAVYAHKNVSYKIVIDAGHGGIDKGAVGSTTGVYESELNLDIAKKLQTLFEEIGFFVVMTRDGDYGLYGDTSKGFKKRDLEKRVEIINKNDPSVFVSIHLNKYSSPSRRGAQVFFKDDSYDSDRLALCVQNEFNNSPDCVKKSNALKGDYYLLNMAKCTSIIVECGFLSSPQDEKLLLNEEYRQKVAKNVFEGTLKYLKRDNL
ncbi:MAG: N-acetylmuramoyl-L-alanine amidase [Clostridia bacterium]|nr:N-acetylmuramoyl-L-alanine amidase [Clostridia bacterium]